MKAKKNYSNKLIPTLFCLLLITYSQCYADITYLPYKDDLGRQCMSLMFNENADDILLAVPPSNPHPIVRAVFDISDPKITTTVTLPAGINEILPNANVLHLRGTINSGELKAILNAARELIDLHLENGVELDNGGIQVIADFLQSTTSLRRLFFNTTTISDENIRTLINAAHRDTNAISIHRAYNNTNYSTDRTIPLIQVTSTRNPSLRYVDLDFESLETRINQLSKSLSAEGKNINNVISLIDGTVNAEVAKTLSPNSRKLLQVLRTKIAFSKIYPLTNEQANHIDSLGDILRRETDPLIDKGYLFHLINTPKEYWPVFLSENSLSLLRQIQNLELTINQRIEAWRASQPSRDLRATRRAATSSSIASPTYHPLPNTTNAATASTTISMPQQVPIVDALGNCGCDSSCTIM